MTFSACLGQAGVCINCTVIWKDTGPSRFLATGASFLLLILKPKKFTASTLWITINQFNTVMTNIAQHPGEFIQTVFIDEGNKEPESLAQELGLAAAEFARLVSGKLRVDEGLARRLASVLGPSPEFWLEMQLQHDHSHSRNSSGLSGLLMAFRRWAAAMS